MRILLKLLAALVALVLLVAGAGLTYLFAAYPNVPPAAAVTLPTAPDAVARGQYLAEHVAICVDCHSERDWSKFAAPIRPGTFGKGGERFARDTDGIPGTIYAPNITRAGIGDWTDGELLHAVTTGVSRDGRAMFPIMPYPNYGRAAEDDVKAILAYVRTLPPIANTVPPRSLEVPMNLIVRTIPGPASFAVRPEPGDRVKYGEYLTRLASCGDCHTQLDDQGQPLPGMAFAGGMEFKSPTTRYRMRTANITPDGDSGIGQWTEEQFINKFKGFEVPDGRELTDAEQRQNTAMPWTQYAGMTREDLGAIYAYLRTVKPVINRVDRFPDAGGSSR